ncbi:hypothetical protein [Pedobacter terrae]|uniref:hypothetical protein n=1 Tax=Pedobacter terrae TaxID=405671 RepID=UPI002FF62154
MLQNFTWQHFLVAASVLTLVWYLAVILLFYRRKVLNLLGRQSEATSDNLKDTAPLPHRWEKGVDILADQDESEVMGKAKLPEGMFLLSSADFGFAGTKGKDKEQQLGLVPDILQDIRLVFKTLAEKDGKKKDFFIMFDQMKGVYPKMAGHPNITQINEFILDHASFHLTLEELENLWD